MAKPRDVEITTVAVTGLRAELDLAEVMYVDSTVPQTESDRQRIYAGDPARPNAAGCEMSVHTVTSNGQQAASIIEETTTLQFSVVMTENWYERYGYLHAKRVKDLTKERLEHPLRDSLYPRGPSGGGGIMEVQDGTNRRMLPFQWDVSTHWTV